MLCYYIIVIISYCSSFFTVLINAPFLESCFNAIQAYTTTILTNLLEYLVVFNFFAVLFSETCPGCPLPSHCDSWDRLQPSGCRVSKDGKWMDGGEFSKLPSGAFVAPPYWQDSFFEFQQLPAQDILKRFFGWRSNGILTFLTFFQNSKI